MKTYPRSILKKRSNDTSATSGTKSVAFIDEKTGEPKSLIHVFEFESMF